MSLSTHVFDIQINVFANIFVSISASVNKMSLSAYVFAIPINVQWNQ